jgi:hypothetical protein
MNYTTTEKELLTVVFACKNLNLILLAPLLFFSDHAALKHLLSKKDSKARLI